MENIHMNIVSIKLHDTKGSEKPYVIQTLFCKCDQCDSQFSDKRNLNKHKLKVHGIGRWISCDLCDSANEHAIYKREQFVHKDYVLVVMNVISSIHKQMN